MKTGDSRGGKAKPRLKARAGGGFSKVAAWQFACFLILILFVWANEIWDFAKLLYGGLPRHASVFYGFTMTAAILGVAALTVGHTYVEQKRILRGLMTVCSYCNRIRIDQNAWQQLEEYVTDHSMIEISHGICAECYAGAAADIEKLTRATAGQAAGPERARDGAGQAGGC